VPLAVAANYSFIAESASMTVHPVRMNGTVVGAPQTRLYFEKMQERVSDFIVKHSGVSKERLRELMMDTNTMALDIGSVLVGFEAVSEGIINEVGGLYEAMEKLYSLVGKT
jgi:ATP-dependent protease ClpP protease subunit